MDHESQVTAQPVLAKTPLATRIALTLLAATVSVSVLSITLGLFELQSTEAALARATLPSSFKTTTAQSPNGQI